MGIRPKLLLIFFVLGFVPVLLLGVLLYRDTVGSAETHLRTAVERDTNGIALNVESALQDADAALASFARSPALRAFVLDGAQSANPVGETTNGIASREIPAEVKESVQAFVLSSSNRFSSITCLSSTGKTLFRAETVGANGGVGNGDNSQGLDFKTANFGGASPTADTQVWNTTDQTPLRSPLVREPKGTIMRYSVPVFTGAVGAGQPRGVLIAELNGNALVERATMGRVNLAPSPNETPVVTSTKRFIVVLDRDGNILYHTNEALRHQQVSSVLPTFKEISGAMISGESGSRFYEKDESKWLVAYRPLPAISASVGVAEDYTQGTSNLNRNAWIALTLYLLFGLVTAVVLAHILRNTARSIERVTEGAVAIAGGRLEQRIAVLSNDETRVLAESFNIMTDRLHEQIARETESRQFQSFMRLSAMLTHDLKNAIAGLSLLVGNMERQFHREEFRADAMKSLTEATDKLRRIVSKLSEPVQSLSSEHQLPRPSDLVPLIKNVVATTVGPASELHEVEVHLPDTLIATVEADRIEKVFENLIMNALEAMGVKSGKLTVEAGKTEQGELFFSVTDTGPGISEEFQRVKLFRAFSTTKKTGIGLGLYTCREILQAHRGRLEVTSSRGAGATFRAVLPFDQKFTESTKVTTV